MEITYRKANRSDLDEICTLVQNAIQTMINQNIMQWDELYPTKEDFITDVDKGQLYVGILHHQIAVVFTLNQEYDEEYNNGKWSNKEKEFYIVHRLCVNPVFQNQGIAKQTLLYIEEYLKQKGIHSIRLDVYSENPHALQLYNKLMYTKVGSVDWRKGRFYLMEKIF